MQALQFLAPMMGRLQASVRIHYPRSFEEAQELYNDLQAIEAYFDSYKQQCQELCCTVPTHQVREYQMLEYHIARNQITARFPKCFDADSGLSEEVVFLITVKSNGTLEVETIR